MFFCVCVQVSVWGELFVCALSPVHSQATRLLSLIHDPAANLVSPDSRFSWWPWHGTFHSKKVLQLKEIVLV